MHLVTLRSTLTLVILAVLGAGARSEVTAPVSGRERVVLPERRLMIATRRLAEVDPRVDSATSARAHQHGVDLADDWEETKGASGGGQGRVGFPFRRDRRGKGLARLERRIVDADEESAAEAKGTKLRITSPRPTREFAPERASTLAAGDDRSSASNADGYGQVEQRAQRDPRWKLLEDDDDESAGVTWSQPEDIGADAKATSTSQLLVVTDGRVGVIDALRASLESSGGSLGEVVPTKSWIVIGGPDAARAASEVPGVMWVGPLSPQDAIARAWDPILAAIYSGDKTDIKQELANVETIGSRVTIKVFVPPLNGDFGDRTRELIDALVARIRAGIIDASGDLLASVTASSSGRFALVSVKQDSLPHAIEWLSSRRAVHRVEPRFRVQSMARLPPVVGRRKRSRSLLNYEANEVVQGGELAGVHTKTPFYDAGITGAGQVVGSGDSGLDGRHCAFSAPGKIAMNRSLTGDFGDHSGHGTHVVGSIVGSLTNDGSGSKYDGVAKDASIAFTDIFYPIKSNKYCYCSKATTCTPAAAAEDFDDKFWVAHPNGNPPRERLGYLYENGEPVPDQNFLACRDSYGTRMCTKFDRTCADEGTTNWLPDGALWNKCCDADGDLEDCAHDYSTNANRFACTTDGAYYVCPPYKSNSQPCEGQTYGGMVLSDLYPDGFDNQLISCCDDMATELYDSAKAAGARIHSDSWGGNTPAYDSMVHQVDQYAWENLKFLPMFAAGNEGDDLLDHAEKRFSNYTDGRYTLGNPANAKNCMSIGAALSDNSEPIDNSWLATKLGDKGIWDSKTDWTWQIGIGGSEGVHWSHLLIRGLRADISISAPIRGNHSLAPVSAVVANCGGLNNATDVKGKIVIFRWDTCLTVVADLQELVTAGAAGMIAYVVDTEGGDRFQVPSLGDSTGWKIPFVTLPLRDGELLRQLVTQRSHGVKLGISGPILPPTNKFDNMASFSSSGPTYDGRIKPDLVAPGDSIYSADVLTDAEAASNDTCQKVDKDGSSMATPIAAGAFALLRQYFMDGFYPSGEKRSTDSFEPSAALLKAVMINGAEALNGFESDGMPIEPPPSPKQGWGRINLVTSVPLPSSVNLGISADHPQMNLIVLDDVDDKIVESNERGLCVDVDGSVEDLRATLVWTDPPGSMLSGGNLVNDLDLKLYFEDGRRLWPLSWNSGDLHFNFNTDIYNNVEKVIWSKPAVGRYWIDVNASSVVEAQCFALVVTGQVTQVDHKSKIQCFAVPSPSPKDYSGTAWFAAACVGVGIFLLCLVMRQSRTKSSQNSGAHTDASVHDTPVVLQQVHAEFAPQLPQPRGAPQPLAMAEPVQQFPLHPPTPPQQVITSFRASAFVEKSREALRRSRQ